ncbi:MAG: HD domain-containing protein [Dehalococcoidia bacterium]|nr:HD domain-containing protein [Dehalococcoidia bacterium]
MAARSALAERAALPSAAVRPSGVEMSLYLTELLDDAVVALSEGGPHGSFALVAVGGYGRREIARHSDVDVMLLVDADRHAEAAVRTLYPLWDAALKVGHSVRTVPQVAEAARASLETYTSILDARFLAGEPRLYEQFLAGRRALVRKTRAGLREEFAGRYAALLRDQPWQLLAVDLKEGRGGLRALHALHWLAAAEAVAGGDWDGPQPERALSSRLRDAREFLMLTRHAVHASVDRPGDVYRPEVAAHAARWLEVDPFDWSRGLYERMREVDAALAATIQPPPPRSRWPWRAPRTSEAETEAQTETETEDLETSRPLGLLRQAMDTVRAGGPLDPLPPAGWLDRVLPEWQALRARPHVAPFHIHPVDVHAMRTLVEVRTVMEHEDFESGTPQVAQALGRPHEVLLAAMLHDIGKGFAGAQHPAAGAVIAERFAARAALPPSEAARLVAAVRHHLLLPAVATRRDIADPEVIRETAGLIGDVPTLQLLYVLAVADARASGPNVWNQWKAQLMRSLYQRVLAVLEAQQPAGVPEVEVVVGALAERFAPEVVRAHLEGLEPGYLVSTSPAAVGDHLALIEAARGSEGAAARYERLGAIDRVTIVAPDRPGLLQDVAGTLAGFSVNMLGGVAYTRADGIAIEVWHVGDALGVGIDERRWSRILAALPAAARGEYDITDRLDEVRRSYPQPPRREDIPTKIHLDNTASRDYSVLEISAPDRRGLLYAVTRALHELRVNIYLAKVDTIGPEVFDAFYIQRETGARIEAPDEVARLERRIAEVLAALD